MQHKALTPYSNLSGLAKAANDFLSRGKTAARIKTDVRLLSGFTLIDVLVGVSLLLIVFAGIFGAYQLSLKTLNQSQRRVVATAIASEFLEQARNLPYGSVGVAGAFPDGDFLASQTVTKNSVPYTVAIDINYVADDEDGLTAPEDSCINDYKRMLVVVSWQGRFEGRVEAAGDIAPQNEVQECGDTGGLLRVNAFDALGRAVESANMNVEDVDTSLTDVCATNSTGTCQVLLPASPPGGGENYKIVVSKAGYSSAATFRSGDIYQGSTIATPENPHATLLEGEITTGSFAIDRLSTFEVETRSSRGRRAFVDSFDNNNLLSALQNTEVEAGNLQLQDSGGVFPSSGSATSVTITDSPLAGWGEAVFQRALPPLTEFTLQVLYHNGVEWVLVPDTDLPGNSTGFSSSPVDLSSLSTLVYSALRLQGNLATSDLAATPALDQWKVSYFTLTDFPLGSIPFRLTGAKLVGEDADENSIFKYEQDHATEAPGSLTIDNMEWDNYTFAVDQETTGLTIVETAPSPQPVSLDPNTTQEVALYLAAENSLLVNVQELGSATPIFSANVRLTKTGFDETQLSNEEGQALFIPLDAGTYTIEATAEGHDDFADTIFVAGNESTAIELQLNPE